MVTGKNRHINLELISVHTIIPVHYNSSLIIDKIVQRIFLVTIQRNLKHLKLIINGIIVKLNVNLLY